MNNNISGGIFMANRCITVFLMTIYIYTRLCPVFYMCIPYNYSVVLDKWMYFSQSYNIGNGNIHLHFNHIKRKQIWRVFYRRRIMSPVVYLITFSFLFIFLRTIKNKNFSCWCLRRYGIHVYVYNIDDGGVVAPAWQFISQLYRQG